MIIVIQKAIEGFKLGVANGTFDDRTQSNSNRSIDFNRLGSVIELSEKFQFDYVRWPKKSNNNPTDWVRLIFCSVSFD